MSSENVDLVREEFAPTQHKLSQAKKPPPEKKDG